MMTNVSTRMWSYILYLFVKVSGWKVGELNQMARAKKKVI